MRRFINGSSTLGYNEVTAVLVNYELRKKVELYNASGETLVTRGKGLEQQGDWSRSKLWGRFGGSKLG